MGFSTVPCNEFVEVLGSKAPVPGGGGASALVGAVGTALGNMVGALTVGKKKYADVEEEMKELMAKATTLQDELLHLIERDAEVFEPLSKAYGMPRETEEEKAEKARVMEIVLKDDAPRYDPFVASPVPDLDLDLDERPVGGLGVHLVKNARLGHGNFAAKVLLGRGAHHPHLAAQLIDDRF